MIDDELFTIKKTSRNDDTFTILTVGGGAPYKDLETFLKAIALLKKRGKSNFKAQIIGIRNASDEYKDFVIKNDIKENCEFISGVPREKMPDYYANCDVMVSTSIAETFGISIGEALASGKPVIATRSGGAEDLITDSNGYLVNVQDYEAVADKLICLMEKGFTATAEEIRNTIVSRYGRRAFKEKINKIYEKVVTDFKNKK
jgi:glycosyltransferase involved in cell wall biosynthesis